MLLFVGFLFTLLLFIIVGGLGGMFSNFVDFPSLLLVLLPLLFFLCASKSGRIITGYIRSSFKKNYEYSKAELESIAAAIKNTIKITLASGGFGFMAGLIAALAHVDIPGLLGATLSVSLITLIYSIAISSFIFFPLQAWAENKIHTAHVSS